MIKVLPLYENQQLSPRSQSDHQVPLQTPLLQHHPVKVCDAISTFKCSNTFFCFR